MVKKIFHIFDIFIDFVLDAVWLKSFVKFLKKYRVLFLTFLSLIFLGLGTYISSWNQEDFLWYKSNLIAFSEEHKLFSYFLFTFSYFIIAFFGLPGTAFFGSVGAFLFGFLKGFLFSLLAVMLGSGFAFLTTRFLLRDFFIKSLKKSKRKLKLNKIYDGLKKNEVYYLFMFRLFPFAPLAVTNIVMGLSSMSFNVFFIVCFLAILPYLLIYADIGTRLSQMENWTDLYDSGLLISLTLLAVMPLGTKYLFRYLKKFKKNKFQSEEETQETKLEEGSYV